MSGGVNKVHILLLTRLICNACVLKPLKCHPVIHLQVSVEMCGNCVRQKNSREFLILRKNMNLSLKTEFYSGKPDEAGCFSARQ